MDDFLSKPIRPAELFAVIDRVLAGRPASEAPPASSTEPGILLDPETLLAACDDDPVLLGKLIRVFQNNVPGSLARVQEAIARQDPAQLRESAHQLRGLLSTFSSEAAQAAARLEAMGAGGELGDAASTFETLAEMIERLGPLLENLPIDELRGQVAWWRGHRSARIEAMVFERAVAVPRLAPVGRQPSCSHLRLATPSSSPRRTMPGRHREGLAMTEPSGYVLETLWEDGEFVLSRGVRDGEPSPLLVVAPASAQPAPGSLARLEHAYALRDELDPAWAARPLRLVRHRGRPTLVLEDPGGEPLARLLGQPWEITSFLRVAIGLATALGRLHERGLIHKDVKPAHILVNAATGAVWLTGFGIASRLPRERQAPEPPEVIAGTLAYMAPEQTGRMNRSIDSRSDLYALGVTFYEMLTGALPFTAADPMEWVHCHIARQPTPPGERADGIPGPLSAIVMKLLAKTAEERYQTAAGVAADLRRCRAEWEAHGRIDPFPLGTQDVPDRLLIPETLYGREREIDALLAAFDRVVADGTPELVLVSGYSGIGKSSVVNELHKVLVPPRGLFASGKFDQYKRDIPYATLAQAFQSLVRPLLGRSEAELGRWRDALSEALGPNGQLIVNLVPELELVIGTQPPVADLPPQDAKNRFQMVFRRFLGVFARPEHPLALFLDDLQWLDAATLDLLEHLVTHSEVRHLLLVGAYRDNEVGPAHPLLRTLEAIREAGARVQEIVLAPLGLDDVGRLVADALHCEPERARPLAQLVQEKTGGNPFFAIQFFTALAEEGLLAFDPVALAWRWDIDRIRAKSYTDNVVDLMAGKLKRFSATTQEALKQLACLGNVVEIATLTLVHGETEEAIARGALGSRPRRTRLPTRERLQIPARPDPAGGVFTDSRRAPCRSPPAHRPRAAGEHDGGPARRASVRCREPVQSGRRTADRPGREGAGGDDSTCVPGERPRRRRPMRRRACILRPAWRCWTKGTGAASTS